MNPLTNIKNINKLNEIEAELGVSSSVSWHQQYKDSAYIFVGGLPYKLTEGDILAVFSQYGEIVNINLVRDKKSGKSQGYCFLAYEDQRSSVLAVDNFNGIQMLGRTIRVDHVANYRAPKDHEDDDEVTKMLRKEGCAPKIQPDTPPPIEEDDEVIPLSTNMKKEVKKKDKTSKKKNRKKKKKSKEQTSSDSESGSADDKISKRTKREKDENVDLEDGRPFDKYGKESQRGRSSPDKRGKQNRSPSATKRDRDYETEPRKSDREGTSRVKETRREERGRDNRDDRRRDRRDRSPEERRDGRRYEDERCSGNSNKSREDGRSRDSRDEGKPYGDKYKRERSYDRRR